MCIGVRMGVHRCTWVSCIVALHFVTDTCAISMDVEMLLSISSITDLETSCWLPALTPQYPVLVHLRILITVSPEGTVIEGHVIVIISEILHVLNPFPKYPIFLVLCGFVLADWFIDMRLIACF